MTGAPAPVRILLVDDSSIFVRVLREVLERDPGLVVEGVAHDGAEAVAAVERDRPDLVIMDVHMPVMNGLDAIELIMASRPTPILIMTGDPRGAAGELSLDALHRGALDVVAKPAAWPVADAQARALADHARLLASIPVVHHPAARLRRPAAHPPPALDPRPPGRCTGVLGIVASTGGPAALAHLLGALPASFRLPIAVVQHIADGFAPSLVSWLGGVCPFEVRLAERGMRPRQGLVLVAPDGVHLELDAAGARLEPAEPGDVHCPSGTRLLASLARTYGPRAAGAVLTGMGHDGAAGLLAIREAGGTTFAQDEASSTVYGMPAEAARLGAAARIASLAELPGLLARLGAAEGPAR